MELILEGVAIYMCHTCLYGYIIIWCTYMEELQLRENFSCHVGVLHVDN